MRNIFVIFCAFVFINASHAQTTYEWSSYNKFDTIHNIGKRHIFKQFCYKGADSLISDGTLIFSNATIGNISACKYSIFVTDTIIQSIMINTFSKASTIELYNYVNNLSINCIPIEFNKIRISNYVITDINITYLLIYIESKNKKKGVLYLKRSP
jgi:hypothetical protein